MSDKGKLPFLPEVEIVDLDDPSNERSLKRKLTVSGFVSSSPTSSVLGPLHLKKGETIHDIVRKRKIEKQKSVVELAKKEDKEMVDHIFSGWMYAVAMPFNQAQHIECLATCEAIGRYGPAYRPPNMTQLRESCLERHVCDIDAMRARHEIKWKTNGCTLLSDGWTDARGRNLMNFLVNSTEGSFYLYSIDTTHERKTTSYIAKALDKAMQVIGPSNVVQICTDNAANYVSAGEILMNKYDHLFWTPCVAHCLDLILEDIGKLPKYKKMISGGRKIATYIYAHGVLHSTFLTISGGKELVRCGVTRFATSFLTLQSLKEQRDNLKKIDWLPWANVTCGSEVQKLIWTNSFWLSLYECLAVSEPLVRLLRLVDQDDKPCMGRVLNDLKMARKHTRDMLKDKNLPLLTQIDKIFDKRWEKHFSKPIFGAGAFLNPNVFYRLSESSDDDERSLASEYELDFQTCLMKMESDRDKKLGLLNDAMSYKERLGHFGMPLAVDSSHSMNPVAWWNSFGLRTRDLSVIAKRILSLCVTASSCERNWSTFSLIHTKRRTRLEVERMGKLVYIHYNKRLNERQLQRKLDCQDDSIAAEDINYNSEWITGEEGPANEWVYGDDGLTWVALEDAMGVNETDGPTTRQYSRGGPSQTFGQEAEFSEEEEEDF